MRRYAFHGLAIVVLGAVLIGAAVAGAASSLGAESAQPAQRTYLLGLKGLRVKPTRLFHGAHSFLADVRWRRWGSTAARGRGVMVYDDAYLSLRAPIRLRASRVRLCGSKRTYQQARITFVRERDHRKYPALEGVRPYGCG